jgi:hypothetical protein
MAGTGGAGATAGSGGSAGAAGSAGSSGGAGGSGRGGGGGGTAGAGGAGGASGSGGTGAGGTSAAYIVADIDGVTTRAEVEAASYWFQGIASFDIALSAKPGTAANTLRWFILAPNDRGTFTCMPGARYIELTPTAQGGATHTSPGTCSVTITAAAPNVGDVVQGTFTATLVGQGTVRAVTNGSFRLPRRADGM